MRVFVKGGAWTNAEDEALRALVQKVGLNRWASISTSIGHKSPEQCQQRWADYLDPSINKGEWTTAEKRKLVEMYEIFPEQWQSIASQLPGRRHWQCKVQYVQMRDGKAEEGEEDVISGADGGFVGAGDYKLYHEMRPAKADTVDGDEYSKQVIEFTRSRLANQKGKKQMRKEKELMVAQTQMLSALERKREMEAAGVETHNQKKAFRKAVEEDARGRTIAGQDDDEDDNAAPVSADLADIININKDIRQAASRKKTMLMASELSAQTAASRKKEAALVPEFNFTSTNEKIAPAPYSSGSASHHQQQTGVAAAPSAVSAGVSAQSASANKKAPVLTIAQPNNDALSALMAHYLSDPTAEAKVFVSNTNAEGSARTMAASAPLTAAANTTVAGDLSSFLDFDDIPAPSSNVAGAVDMTAISAALVGDDLFGDLPAPASASAAPPINTAEKDEAANEFGDINEEEDEDDDEEEDEEEAEPVNYIYKAMALVASEARIHWDAKGEWDSARQQGDMLKQARALVEAEMAAMDITAGAVARTTMGGGAADEMDNAVEEAMSLLPALIHPRVAKLQQLARDGAFSLNHHTNTPSNDDEVSADTATKAAAFTPFFMLDQNTVREEEIEVEVLRATVAADLGIVAPSSVSSSSSANVNSALFTIDDTPKIVAGTQKLHAALTDLAAVEEELRFYREVFEEEKGEAFRRRLVQKGSPEGLLKQVPKPFAAALLSCELPTATVVETQHHQQQQARGGVVAANTKRPREGDDAHGTKEGEHTLKQSAEQGLSRLSKLVGGYGEC